MSEREGMFELKFIVALDEENGIGAHGTIPWYYPADLKRFRRLTVEDTVLMGYRTWRSLPTYPKGLAGRRNIVLTRNHYLDPELLEGVGENNVFTDMHKAIDSVEGTLWIIGGAQIYTEILMWYIPHQIYITVVRGTHNADTFFPMGLLALDRYDTEQVKESLESAELVYKILTYNNVEEHQYLSHFSKVLQHGNIRGDRTGVGTISLFAPEDLTFSLRDGVLPVLTTKKMFTRGVLAELLWFMSGSTDSRILEAQGVNIWKGNTSQQFLQNRGLPYDEGDIGAGYGFQWRHFGATYVGMNADYTGQGTDQLANLVADLRRDPQSRRLLLCSWNAADLGKMALPPCHLLYQCYVREDSYGQKWLSAKMYQRSADSFLGVPFNIVSYALLTHILAALTGMRAETLTMSFGDYHIYQNHVNQVHTQLQRVPYPFPKVQFTRDLNGLNVEDVCASDIRVLRSSSHSKLTAEMAV